LKVHRKNGVCSGAKECGGLTKKKKSGQEKKNPAIVGAFLIKKPQKPGKEIKCKHTGKGKNHGRKRGKKETGKPSERTIQKRREGASRLRGEIKC